MKLQNLFESSSFTGGFIVEIARKSEMPLTAEESAPKIKKNSKKWLDAGAKVIFSTSKSTLSRSPGRIEITANSMSAMNSTIDDLKEMGILIDTFKIGQITYEVDDVTESDFPKFPREIDCGVIIRGEKLESLHNLHKYVTRVNGYFSIFAPIKSSILPLVMIKGIKGFRLNISGSSYDPNSENIEDLLQDILEKYSESGDMFGCQDALMDAGLEEYAAL